MENITLPKCMTNFLFHFNFYFIISFFPPFHRVISSLGIDSFPAGIENLPMLTSMYFLPFFFVLLISTIKWSPIQFSQLIPWISNLKCCWRNVCYFKTRNCLFFTKPFFFIFIFQNRKLSYNQIVNFPSFDNFPQLKRLYLSQIKKRK